MNSVCVYCGSSSGKSDEFITAARELGETLASSGVVLVYGGAHVGLMGVVAEGALRQGGKVIGIIPESMRSKEIAHEDLTELHIVRTMHERKAMMARLSEGFIALPGGFGTLDELFEILTWAQLGMHQRPIGILNVAGFFDPLLEFVDRIASCGFLRPEHRDLLLSDAKPEALLEKDAESPCASREEMDGE